MRALIVDGYNVVHAWPSLKRLLQSSGLEDARTQLVRLLAEYAAQTGTSVTVVYDSHGRTGATQTDEIDGVTVLFGSRTASADHVIERLAYEAARRGDAADVVVATSDRLQRAIVSAVGAATMSALALEAEVARVLAETDETSRRIGRTGHAARRVEDRLSPDVRARLDALRRGIVEDTTGPEEPAAP